MRGYRIRDVGQKNLEVRGIKILLTRLRDGDAIESDVSLIQQRVVEIIGHGREVREVHILSGSRDQFTPDVEFDIQINVSIVIGRYKKFHFLLIDVGEGFVRGLYRP